MSVTLSGFPVMPALVTALNEAVGWPVLPPMTIQTDISVTVAPIVGGYSWLWNDGFLQHEAQICCREGTNQGVIKLFTFATQVRKPANGKKDSGTITVFRPIAELAVIIGPSLLSILIMLSQCNTFEDRRAAQG